MPAAIPPPSPLHPNPTPPPPQTHGGALRMAEHIADESKLLGQT